MSTKILCVVRVGGESDHKSINMKTRVAAAPPCQPLLAGTLVLCVGGGQEPSSTWFLGASRSLGKLHDGAGGTDEMQRAVDSNRRASSRRLPHQTSELSRRQNTIRAGAAPSNYLCIDPPDLFIAISPAAQTKSNEPTISTDKPIEQKTNRTGELSRRQNTSRRAGAAPFSQLCFDPPDLFTMSTIFA